MTGVSFIIPAFNEAHQIHDVVMSVRNAAEALHLEHEILVVNDASTDETERLARDAGATVLNVEKRQIAAVRNAGARAAAAPRLVFLDGDTFLNHRTLTAALGHLEAGGVGGGALIRFDDASLFGRVVIWAVARGLRVFGCCGGCFMFATRDAFDATGGFDETLFASEEISFARALRQVGRFSVLREPIVTSGRELRRYSALSLLWTAVRIGLRGPAGVRRREGLEIWYDGQR